MVEINRNLLISSLFWKLVERGGSQLVGFIVTIVLARLLSPSEFGLIAIVNIFISLATVFVQGGLNTALIQKKSIDKLDKSTVFYLSFGIFSLLYALLYFASPFIASFFGFKDLTLLVRVIALTVLFGSFNSIQLALLTRGLEFKNIFKGSFMAILLSGIAGVVAAYHGCGVWALVIQQFVSQITQMFVLFHSTRWFPDFSFSLERLKLIFPFSMNIMLSNLLTQFFMDIRSLVIGKWYSASDLSFFDRGRQFPYLIMSNVNTSVLSVLFPAFSSMHEDVDRMRALLRRSIKTIAFIVFPLMVGLFVISKPLVEVLLTSKWAESVPYIQVFAIIYMLTPLHQPNIEAIKAMGKGGLVLKLDILRKAVECIALIVSISFGPLAIAFGALFACFISLFINLYPNRSLLQYGYLDQFLDILPSLLIALTMGGIVYSVALFNLPSFALLLIQILVGFAVYFSAAYIFRVEAFYYIVSIIRKK